MHCVNNRCGSSVWSNKQIPGPGVYCGLLCCVFWHPHHSHHVHLQGTHARMCLCVCVFLYELWLTATDGILWVISMWSTHQAKTNQKPHTSNVEFQRDIFWFHTVQRARLFLYYAVKGIVFMFLYIYKDKLKAQLIRCILLKLDCCSPRPSYNSCWTKSVVSYITGSISYCLTTLNQHTVICWQLCLLLPEKTFTQNDETTTCRHQWCLRRYARNTQALKMSACMQLTWNSIAAPLKYKWCMCSSVATQRVLQHTLTSPQAWCEMECMSVTNTVKRFLKRVHHGIRCAACEQFITLYKKTSQNSAQMPLVLAYNIKNEN